MLSEFRDFIARGSVIDLAVGIVAGAAFGALVTSMVEFIVTPLIGLVFALFGGEPTFAQYRLFATSGGDWLIFSDGSDAAATGGILIGAFIDAVIKFVSVMAGLFFFVVKPANALAERMKRGDGDEGPVLKECPECLSEVPALARRCMHCTTQLAPTP